MDFKEELLKKIITEFSKIKNVKSIIQVGSSLWDDSAKDLDLILVIKGKAPSFNDLKSLSKVKEKFNKENNVSFNSGGIISELKGLNVDLVIIPENYELFYSFNPFLIYGMSLNPYKVLYGYDFFKKIKPDLKPNNEMILKFGSLSTYYLFFLLGFDSMKPENSAIIISNLKVILYPLVFMKGVHVKKKELIPFLKKNYPFFSKLCEKFKISDDLFYKKTLSGKEIKNIYSFAKEMIENAYKYFIC